LIPAGYWHLAVFSGIIATSLGSCATSAKDAGRERRVHHSKSLPLLFIGERFFFGLENSSKVTINVI
jgi:hypothetical protein